MTLINGIKNQFSQENRTRNTAAGAAVGAAAGAGIGYATKQIATVKDGKTFLSADIFNRVVSTMGDDVKGRVKSGENVRKLYEDYIKVFTEFFNAEVPSETSDETIKKAYSELKGKTEASKNALRESLQKYFKDNKVKDLTGQEDTFDLFSKFVSMDGANKSVGVITDRIKLTNTKMATLFKEFTTEGKKPSVDEMKQVIAAYVDTVGKDADLAIKGIDVATITEDALKDENNVKGLFSQIENALKFGETNKTSLEEAASNLFEQGTRKFADLGDKATEATNLLKGYIMKATKSAKLKQAAIFGAVGALVVGVAAFLVSRFKSQKAQQTEQNK